MTMQPLAPAASTHSQNPPAPTCHKIKLPTSRIGLSSRDGSTAQLCGRSDEKGTKEVGWKPELGGRQPGATQPDATSHTTKA